MTQRERRNHQLPKGLMTIMDGPRQGGFTDQRGMSSIEDPDQDFEEMDDDDDEHSLKSGPSVRS
jgi:hypothetical protein